MRNFVWMRRDGLDDWGLYDKEKSSHARARVYKDKGYYVQLLVHHPEHIVVDGVWRTVVKFPPDTPIETVKQAAVNFCLLGMDTGN